MDDDEPILAKLEEVAALLRKVPAIPWGTVTQTTPLLVQLDGDVDADGNPVTLSAQSVVNAIPVGRRVLCVEQDRRVIVIAVADV